MTKEQNYDDLKRLALGEGMALFGVADVRAAREDFSIPQQVARKLDFGISLGYRLSSSILDTIESAPNQLYYFHYQRANILLDQTALKIAAWIQDKGFEALPLPASQVTDWEKQRGSVSHREIGRLAGLGWYGRNNLLVTPKFGSQVRFATVLTNIPLSMDSVLSEGCGTCQACVSACPAGAIKEASFSLELCSRKLKDFMKTERIGQMICGVCVKACRGQQK